MKRISPIFGGNLKVDRNIKQSWNIIKLVVIKFTLPEFRFFSIMYITILTLSDIYIQIRLVWQKLTDFLSHLRVKFSLSIWFIR